MVPMLPTYKDKDSYFTKFITGVFQTQFLEKIEQILAESSGKYLFGDSITIADCLVGAFLLRLAGNPSYEHQLILRVIVDQF